MSSPSGSVIRLADIGQVDLPGALVVYGPDGRVQDATATACEILGEQPEQFIGSEAAAHRWQSMERPGRMTAEPLHPAVEAARSRRPQLGVLVRVERPDGSVVWVQVDAIPTLASDGSVSHVIATIADVTSLVGELSIAAAEYDIPALTGVTRQMANARLAPEALLSAVTASLSRMRPGTWIASLINKDPRTVRVVAANVSDPLLARYVEDMHSSGQASASSIAMQVIESGRPMIMQSVPYPDFVDMLRTDVRDYLAANRLPTAARAGAVGILVVPMRARGATVGALGVYTGASATPPTQNDVAWLQAIADRTGMAADNAQLHADSVRRLERLTALRNIGLVIAGSRDLRLIFQVILDQVIAGLKVDAADLFLLDEAGTALVMSAQAGFQSTSIPDYRLPVDDKLPGRILSRPHIESVTEGSALSRFRRRTLFAREGFRAYCAAPLVARNHASGVLEVFTRSAFDLDDEWLGFLEALASYAAVAIDGASMSERLDRASVGPRRAAAGAPKLNNLERQILGLLVEGTTNADIAKSVHLSQSTVKFHVRQILQRVGASNRTELARKATREGWV
jgi:PAS domain S-box-containing protein